MMRQGIIMITRDFKMRRTNDISVRNEVCNFNFLHGVHYPAISIEAFYPDREEGFYEIIAGVVKLVGHNQSEGVVVFYSELDTLIRDSKLNRYKGFWRLKPSKNNGFDWLVNKKEFAIEKDGLIKMSGYSIVNDIELKKIISIISYGGNNFFAFINKSHFDEGGFCDVINSGSYTDVMIYFLNCNGLVFLQLGDEDFKSSEVVVIGTRNILEMISGNLKLTCSSDL